MDRRRKIHTNVIKANKVRKYVMMEKSEIDKSDFLRPPYATKHTTKNGGIKNG